jgi:hypothetical protein
MITRKIPPKVLENLKEIHTNQHTQNQHARVFQWWKHMQIFDSKTKILSKNRERITWKRTKSLPGKENKLFDPQRRPAQGRSWPNPTPLRIGDHYRDRPNFQSLEQPSFVETKSEPILAKSKTKSEPICLLYWCFREKKRKGREEEERWGRKWVGEGKEDGLRVRENEKIKNNKIILKNNI